MESLGVTQAGAALGEVPEAVLAELGPRLRRARQERGMKLEELAAATGTSAAQLSRVESGERQPSLMGLLKIAGGLGVPVAELLAAPPAPRPGTVVRGAEEPVIEGPAMRFQPLVPEAGPEGLVAVKVVLPADRVDPEHHRHEGQEWLYVLQGRLRLTLGPERTVLGPGDAAFFDGMLEHAFDVLSEEDVEVLMVACVPCPHRGGARAHPFREGHGGMNGGRREEG
jgi:transcriptional regulator with XRE-family HTH domain